MSLKMKWLLFLSIMAISAVLWGVSWSLWWSIGCILLVLVVTAITASVYYDKLNELRRMYKLLRTNALHDQVFIVHMINRELERWRITHPHDIWTRAQMYDAIGTQMPPNPLVLDHETANKVFHRFVSRSSENGPLGRGWIMDTQTGEIKENEAAQNA